MVAKMAASVSVLSDGRLDLGLGAGWYAGEHQMFGHAFPTYANRLKMLDEGATVIKALWSGEPTTFTGQYYRLAAAESYPLPVEHRPVVIMGGKGDKTLEVVARHATEWNCSYVGLDVFRTKSAQLDENCIAIDRDPASLQRSLMVPFVIGVDTTRIQDRIHAHRTMFPNLPVDLSSWHKAGFVGGTPDQLLDQLKAFEAAGVQRFMLQHNDLDDVASLELLASRILPQFDT
jgi:alkanesulfonate monooxygenase SsuD/methylene tetrahydromethanopterin reductase-like flavin-dependent oxidoreductase (luciferase family)